MIGVFDSGFGGLTVLDALIRRLPDFDYFYLGDSARAPYGARSLDVIYEFTREAVEFLFDAGCPLVILACNTASARALRTLQQRHLPARRPSHRILGVVRPSAEALAGLPPEAPPGSIARVSATGTVAVLGTAGTIASDSYRIELAKLAPQLQLVQQACPLWVPLVEEGELAGPGTDYFLHKYLDPILASPARPERILLACTHYPLLRPAIRAIVDSFASGVADPIEILDQGEIVASRLAQWLARHPEMTPRLTRNGARRYATTDDPGWFGARAEALLGREVVPERVHLQPFGGNAVR
jgi:glutamate racemase